MIIRNIGCISTTGLEDGYKKINQDKLCVLAQFLEPQQSFFAALDGHGPSGAPKRNLSAITNCQLQCGFAVRLCIAASTDTCICLERLDTQRRR